MPKDHPNANVDAFTLDRLATESEYWVETEDGWTLVVTRFEPKPQRFHQPLAGVPMLLVHGFSQNRYAWTAGELVKNLAFFGADLHILELRGHGKSSRALQIRRHRREGKPVPEDFDFQWDVDSYFMMDLPAAIQAIKRRTGRRKLLYIGHSMGGMLGYGLASHRQNDLLGLVTIGSPSDIGQGWIALQAMACLAAVGLPIVDLGLWHVNRLREARYGLGRAASRLADRGVPFLKFLGDSAPAGEPPRPLRFTVFPVDLLLRTIGYTLTSPQSALSWLPRHLPFMWNPERANPERIKAVLNIGGGPEPRKVVEQFVRWVLNDEIKCYRLNYDFRRHFSEIRIPIAIIFGDEDRVAGLRSTKSIYRMAKSDYLLWRPVRGNSHVEITMGHDIRQVCYDIKNLTEYALRHQRRPRALPKIEGGEPPSAAQATEGWSPFVPTRGRRRRLHRAPLGLVFRPGRMRQGERAGRGTRVATGSTNGD